MVQTLFLASCSAKPEGQNKCFQQLIKAAAGTRKLIRLYSAAFFFGERTYPETYF
jgi:hypothetical protein